MTKKLFTILITVFIFGIVAFHYILNFNKEIQPPSNEWSKEVEISSGYVFSNPALIGYMSDNVVVHSDKGKVKVLLLEKLAKSKKEKTFDSKSDVVLKTNAVTDGTNIYVYWMTSKAGIKSVHCVKLDYNLNVLSENNVGQVEEMVQAGDNLIIFNYKNKIELIDFSLNKTYSVETSEALFLAVSKNKNGYIISFNQGEGEYKYFTLQDDEVSEVKALGTVPEMSSISYVNQTILSDDNYGYLVMEFRFKGDYAGAKLVKFSLNEEGKFEISEFKINNNKVMIFNSIPYYKEGAARLLGNVRGMVEHDITNNSGAIRVSRTKQVSIFPAVHEDTAIFCTMTDKDYFKVYMASKNDDFKAAYKYVRPSEVKEAIFNSISGIMLSLVYMIPYGSFWIIPIVVIISIYSVVEYKYSDRRKRVSFWIMYCVFFLIKGYFLYTISYKRFGNSMSDFMAVSVFFIIPLLASILCSVYAYTKYNKGIEGNIGAVNFILPVTYDSVLTLLMVVPFMVRV